MIHLKRLYAHNFKQLHEVELTFPPAGRILVQGKNEAGKSTLFEAVFFALFGRGLITESSARSLDNLIAYEKEKARVELELTVRDRLFKITRTLRRGRSNVWELDIVHADGRLEQVRNNNPVNERLVRELGFDGEALLNTCFVEQKKLEKLEGMNRREREESLSKLLNLERLLELEEKFKLRSEDEKLLARLQRRVELAEAQAALPGVQEALAHAERQLKRLDLYAYVERARQELRAYHELATERVTMQTRRDELGRVVARLEALDQARRLMETTLMRVDALTQDTERLRNLQTEREMLTRAVAENLPALETRLAAIRRLGTLAKRLTFVETARAQATLELQRAQSSQQELDTHLERGNQLNETITRLQTRLTALDQNLRDYALGEALGEWAAAAQAADLSLQGATTLEARRTEREALYSRQRRYLIYFAALALGILAAGTLVLPALAFATRNLWLTILVAIVLAALGTLFLIVLIWRLFQNVRAAARLAEEIGKLEGAISAQQEQAQTAQAQLTLANEKLVALGVAVPASVAQAHATRVEIAARLENKTRAELAAERESVLEQMNYARAQRDEVVKRINDLSAKMTTDPARCERVLARCERLLQRWRPILARRAAALDLAPEIEALREAYSTVQSEIKTWQLRVEQASKLKRDATMLEEHIQKTRGELALSYAQATALVGGQVPEWSETLERATYLQVQQALNAAFEAEGGERVRAELSALEHKLGATERECKIRQRNVAEAMAAARTLLPELGLQVTLSDPPTLQELDALAAHFEDAPREERKTWETRVTQLYQRVGALRDTIARLERELGLVGERVDLEAARAELERERREQAQRQYAAEIVSRTRRRVMQKVLPATMDHMRRILPQLTRDRYHDAELDPESYKIRVWDERAGQSGAWKEKNIFSGGTKDQFSLALRLAFALATLPHERGTTPGFIFLDEPLGSFDQERANALLFLLTEGEIARAFDQIFLISHVPVPESYFTHKIHLENGRVVEG